MPRETTPVRAGSGGGLEKGDLAALWQGYRIEHSSFFSTRFQILCKTALRPPGWGDSTAVLSDSFFRMGSRCTKGDLEIDENISSI